jgi:hypothetical protein
MKSPKKLSLHRETLHVLSTEAANSVDSGRPTPTIIVDTVTIVVDTVVQTITIIASSPCSNVYSKCRACPA